MEPDENEDLPLGDDYADLEAIAKAGGKPPRQQLYRIRINKEHFKVKAPAMTGRQLLELAGKIPAERHKIYQMFHGGERKPLGLDQKADFTTPGVERFETIPLDQTEG